MDENNGLNEFMEAFGESADNQIEDAAVESVNESTESEQNAQTESAEAQTQGQNAETPAQEQTPQKEDGKEQTPDAQPETFTLKVNKEEKTYSREEVISLAQKGADYDRVKDQLTRSKEEKEQLQTQLDSQKEAVDVLNELAKDAGVEPSAMIRNLRVGLLKKQGLSEDAANERLLRMDAEKENAVLKAAAETAPKETPKDRAQRELAEFRNAYPDVELTEEVLGALMADVQSGTTLTNAYQKYESAKKDAQIAELQRQLAAEKQNKENLASSPGSQADSGGKRTKSDFDDFMDAFR